MYHGKIILLIISASISNLLLTSSWYYLGIYSSELRYYFYEKPSSETLLIIFLFLGFGILIFILLIYFNSKKYLKIETFFKFILFILIIDIFRRLSGLLSLSILIQYKIFLALTILLIFIFFFKFYKILNKIISIFFLVLSPFVIINAVNLIKMNFIDDWDNKNKLITEKNYTNNNNKIIYLVFDELDQKFIDTGNYKSFNNLINQADYYINTMASGDSTITNMISITTGTKLKTELPLDKKFYKFTNNDISFVVKEKRYNWSEYKNIFNTLDKKKYKVGVVGYAHRYCNIFYKNLNMCFEINDETFTIKNIGIKKYLIYSLTNIIPANSKIGFFANYSLMNFFLSDSPNLRIKNVIKLKKIIKKLIYDNDFIFIHLPLPHSPWIYKDGKITSENINQLDQSEKNYSNNMMFTDIFFGEIIKELKEKKIYDSSTIIISSDHSWRNSKNYVSPRKYPNTYDDNIVLIVKNKNQDQGTKIEKQTFLHDIFKIIEQVSND